MAIGLRKVAELQKQRLARRERGSQWLGNNPLKYIDPHGQDITYFYDPGGVAGHAVLFAYNQATGDSAIESFGPKVHSPVWTGESNFDMSEFNSVQGLRKTTHLSLFKRLQSWPNK